ncbi:MAG: membrane-bound lytic murein transglycosylase MltF [Gammaproteobacteria bacterium]|nr:MAG: membrane-bound lytic murein transglycosylase MltF [Gammaproteobacteria bacterium]
MEIYLKYIGLLLLSLNLLIACDEALPHLEEIHERGELRVLTRYGPTSYYVKGEELAGFEYELAQKFAEHLNVKLKIIVPDNLADILSLIEQGKADVAAAGLTITPVRQDKIRFGPVYQEVTQQLVYRQGTKRPKDITALSNGQLEVVASSSHVEQLLSHQQEVPELSWTGNTELDSSGLLELVQLEMIDYTVADSNEIAANRPLFPELQVAFNVSEPQALAWAIPLSEDNSLYEEIVFFFNEMDESGELDLLIEKYYGHIRRFNYVDTRAIHRKILTHLPRYQRLFEQAGIDNNIDWRLLAAVSYQESHWDPKAVSSTGVKGLMMLTLDTAKQMNIEDREDPLQSIPAGAAYLASIHRRLPEQIDREQDRLWMALASYNIGLGHLEDARVLAQNDGANPNLWSDVRKYLPLLTKKKWYQSTRYGYARGGEAVRYIENIRRYYDILVQSPSTMAIIEDSTEPEKPDLPASL